MEKKTGVAIAVTVLFFLLYYKVILPMIPGAIPPEPPAPVESDALPPEALPTATTPDAAADAAAPQLTEPAAPPAEPSTIEVPAETPTVPAAETPAAETPAVPAKVAVPEEFSQQNLQPTEFAVSTDLYDVLFTTLTGSVKSVTLKNYDSFDRTGKLVLMREFTEGRFPTAISTLAGDDLSKWLWVREEAPGEKVQGEQTVAFSTVLPSGFKLTKTYTFYENRYGFALTVTVGNLTAAELPLSYDLLGPTGIPFEDFKQRDVSGVLASVPVVAGPEAKMSSATTAAGKLASKGPVSLPAGSRLVFAGVLSRYFTAVIRPDTASVPLAGAYNELVEDTFAQNQVSPSQSAGAVLQVKDPQNLGPAGSGSDTRTHAYIIYCGPKKKDMLAAFDTESFKTGFPTLLNYGWLEPLVKIILVLLGAFHRVVPNWGVSIIILTLLMRSLMHPLMRKSQVSMVKMQKLQPHIQKLKEKYKNDKQRLGQEQMKLMKESGANPLGGCLPMLIQMPIFFALYRSLMLSIDLRQAPFVLWIQDLAQADHLLQLPFQIPLLGTNWLNLLPILMLSSMMLQQKLMPKPATPEAAQQQKMMALLMPVFIGFILYTVASGLNLYILTSTVFGITEQWWIRRHLAARDQATPPAKPKPRGK